MSLYSSPQDSQQFELFRAEDESGPVKKGLFSRKISLAVEHLVMMSIAVVVFAVVMFSIGFERGKKTAVEKMGGLEINLANAENDVIMPTSSEPSVNVSTTVAAATPVVKPAPAAVAPTQDIVVNIPVPDKQPVQETAPAGVYTVQLASFKQESMARKEVDALKKKGYEAFSILKGAHYIVCVGKYQKKTMADKTANSLKSKYADNLVRRL